MRLKNIIKNYWLILITCLIFTFWLGFFITENIYNQNNTYYISKIETSSISVSNIDVDFFLDALRKEDGSYSYATVKPNDFFENDDINITVENNGIKISIKAKYFIGSEESIISIKSQERFSKVLKKVINFYDSEAIIKPSETIKYVNPLKIAIYCLVGGFFAFSLAIVLLRNKLPILNEEIYKSKEIFKHPFSKDYWKLAIKSFRKMKVFDMCLISILFALQMIMKFITIPSGFASLGLGLTYLVFAYICLIYGPVWGLIIGFASDVFGFIISPTVFHFGYTLQAMLTGFVYGICFYRTDLKFSKVLLSRIIVNIILNGVFGALLWGDFAELNHEATITYMLTITLPKNIIYLIPQSLLLYLFLRLAVPLLTKKNIVPKEVIQENNNLI